MANPKKKHPTGSVAYNRKANFDVTIEDKWEAGLILHGDEIKSIRAGRVQLTGGYVRLLSGVPAVIGIHLSQGSDPDRTRKLLLSAKQIADLQELLHEKGKVAVPLDIHFSHGWAKLTIGIGTGRKVRDKRGLLKQRAIERDLARL